MRAALLVIAGIALIGFLAVAVVLPRMAGSEAREAAQALVAGAEPAKQQVTAAAEKSGRLDGAGEGVKVAAKNDPKHGEMKWIVSQNGAIRGWNEKNALEVTLMPTLQGGKASWNCKGYPMDAMPANCGGRI
jgi:type II secretory pathway pseudopilin PulG